MFGLICPGRLGLLFKTGDDVAIEGPRFTSSEGLKQKLLSKVVVLELESESWGFGGGGALLMGAAG